MRMVVVFNLSIALGRIVLRMTRRGLLIHGYVNRAIHIHST
jgi:hypothetical protein